MKNTDVDDNIKASFKKDPSTCFVVLSLKATNADLLVALEEKSSKSNQNLKDVSSGNHDCLLLVILKQWTVDLRLVQNLLAWLTSHTQLYTCECLDTC